MDVNVQGVAVFVLVVLVGSWGDCVRKGCGGEVQEAQEERANRYKKQRAQDTQQTREEKVGQLVLTVGGYTGD